MAWPAGQIGVARAGGLRPARTAGWRGGAGRGLVARFASWVWSPRAVSVGDHAVMVANREFMSMCLPAGCGVSWLGWWLSAAGAHGWWGAGRRPCPLVPWLVSRGTGAGAAHQRAGSPG